MSETEPRGGRPLESLRRTLRNLQALLAGRLELASLELTEEKYRLISLLLLVHGVWVFATLALIFTTLTVVVLTWDSPARTWVLPGFAVLYLGGALWAFGRLRHRLRNDPPPFSGTVDEFKKDREWFSNET